MRLLETFVTWIILWCQRRWFLSTLGAIPSNLFQIFGCQLDSEDKKLKENVINQQEYGSAGLFLFRKSFFFSFIICFFLVLIQSSFCNFRLDVSLRLENIYLLQYKIIIPSKTPLWCHIASSIYRVNRSLACRCVSLMWLKKKGVAPHP